MTVPAIFPSLTRDEVFRLETPRLWLRWPTMADAQSLRHWVGKPDVATMTSSFPVGISVNQLHERIAEVRAANADGCALGFVLTHQGDDDSAIGMVGVSLRANGALALGYHLHPALWGQGLMTEAVKRLVNAAFALTPELDDIEASVRPDNIGSRRVLEKCGFASVGLGELLSPHYGRVAVKRYVRLRSEPSPLALAAARHAPTAPPLGFQLCGLV